MVKLADNAASSSTLHIETADNTIRVICDRSVCPCGAIKTIDVCYIRDSDEEALVVTLGEEVATAPACLEGNLVHEVRTTELAQEGRATKPKYEQNLRR
jgi:hypothetical protein